MGTKRGPVRILVVDDHAIVREGIRACLKDRRGLRIIGDAANGVEAIAKTEELKPHVVLLLLAMPIMGGLDALPKIRSLGSKVIVVTVHESRDFLRHAMAAQADGYLLKDTAPSEYVEAIQSVVGGRVFISPRLVAVPARAYSPLTKRFGLTPREVKFLSLASNGQRTPEIAAAMGCSETAVRSYQRRTMTKLGVSNVALLTRIALEHGL